MNGLLANLNPFDSALVSEMRAGSATVETNIPVSAVVANPELAQVSRAAVAPQRGTPLSTRSPGTRGKTDQASLPPIGPRSLPIGPTTAAGDTGENIVSSPAAFSLDLRIHNVMLAVADELADEQRTINERLLLRQFAPESRRA